MPDDQQETPMPTCEYCDEPKEGEPKLPEHCGKCGALACEEHFPTHWCIRVSEAQS